MKVTSLLSKEDAMLERDVRETSERVAKYSSNWFGRRPKKADGIIDAEVVGLAKWKKLAASWILRIGRCITATDPALVFISTIGLVAGIMFGMAPIMSMSLHDQTPSFLWVIGNCLFRIIELILLGWALLYAGWELVQGWRWLSNWSKRIKQEEMHENSTEIKARRL